MIGRARNVRPYRASTTAGPVVVVANTYADAMSLLETLGYEVLDMRGSIPISRAKWFNVISPAWWRVQYEQFQKEMEEED